MKSAGRETPSASSVIGSVEVLEPSSAPSARCGSISPNTWALTPGSSKTASITRSAPSAADASVARRDQREQGVALLLRGLAALDALGDELLRVALAALGGGLVDVLEHDLDAGLRAHVRDRGAHHARAEDHDLRGLEGLDRVRPPAVPVDLLEVEEERLDHVLGDLALGEVHEVAALDLQRGVEVDLRALDDRGHDVVRRRVVRALDLLAQVRREGRQVLRELRVRRQAARDLVALDVPGLLGLRILRDPLLRGRDQLLGRAHELVDEAHLLGLRRADPLALEQDLHQPVDDAEHARDAHDAAGAGQQAELDLGLAELDLRVVDDDPAVTGERDLQAAAQRGAVDGGHDRLAERLEPAQQRLVLAHPAGELVGGLGRDLLEVVEVAAGEEGLLRAGQDDAGDRVLLGLQALDGLPHRRAEVGVHRVGGLVRVVEDEVDDPVAGVFPADGVGHQMASTTVAMPMPPPTQSVARP